MIPDGAAASFMARGEVDLVVTGADRIAANGDTANKIGTYSLAVLAAHHELPLIVVAPTSTLDPATASGADIPIEERDPAEVTARFPARNPAFDVTPAALVSAIVTEGGVHRRAVRAVRFRLRHARLGQGAARDASAGRSRPSRRQGAPTCSGRRSRPTAPGGAAGGGGAVGLASFSRRLATRPTASSGGGARLYRTDGTLVRRLGAAAGAAFSPDGTLLATWAPLRARLRPLGSAGLDVRDRAR